MLLRGRKLDTLLVFISQSYLKVPKTIRLNASHCFIMKIPNIMILKIYWNFIKIILKEHIHFYCSVQFYFKARVCLKYFVHCCFCKHIFASNSDQVPLILICATTFITPRPLAQFKRKIRGTKLKKSVKIDPT